MTIRKLSSILVIVLVLLGACVSPSAAPPTLPAPPETQAPAPTPAPPDTPVPIQPPVSTPAPTPTLTPTSTPAPTTPSSTTTRTAATPAPIPPGAYAGPLFDTHLHMGRILDWRAERLRSYFERSKVDWFIGFYPFPSDRSSRLGSLVEPIVKAAGSRVIPLLQPSSGDWSDLVSGQFTEAVLRQYLQPQGLLRGVGEIALYKTPLQSVTFNSPSMQTVFQVVNESKGIVMIHPSMIPEGARQTELAEIEPSIRKYPDAIFLFHGIRVFNLVTQLMSKYPNVYFSVDFASAFYKGEGVLLYPTDAGSDNAASFLAGVNRTGLDSIVERNLKDLAPWLQRLPDRIFWGTDLDFPWHFEESATDVVIRISRQFIGRLPAGIQEKYAYQNAQKVFGRFLTPKP